MKKIGYPDNIKLYIKPTKKKCFKLNKTQTSYISEKEEFNGRGGG